MAKKLEKKSSDNQPIFVASSGSITVTAHSIEEHKQNVRDLRESQK
jgi:hypothetical protein